MKKIILISALGLAALTTITSCEEKTPKDKFKDSMKEMGDKIKDGAEDVGDVIKDGAEDTKEIIEEKRNK